jgi:short-subunit dehydrogenase
VLRLGAVLHIEFQKLGLPVTVLVPSPTDTPMLAEFSLDVDTMPIKPLSVEHVWPRDSPR